MRIKGTGGRMAAVLMAAGLLATACAPQASDPAEGVPETAAAPAGGRIGAIEAAGKLVLGTAADYPPYGFVAKIDGNLEVVGFEIDIAREIARDLDVDMEIRDMAHDELLAALAAGDVDVVLAGMVPTDQQKSLADFSMAYYHAEQRLLVRAADVSAMTAIESLAGRRIGAQRSTMQEQIATEQIPDPGELRFRPRINDLVLELKNGRIDGVVLVGTVAAFYADADALLELSEIRFGQAEGIAVAVAKGSDDLTAAVNATLERLMAADMIHRFIAEANALAAKPQAE